MQPPLPSHRLLPLRFAARGLRENCALLLDAWIAAIFARLFGRLEQLLRLFQSGQFPPAASTTPPQAWHPAGTCTASDHPQSVRAVSRRRMPGPGRAVIRPVMAVPAAGVFPPVPRVAPLLFYPAIGLRTRDPPELRVHFFKNRATERARIRDINVTLSK